MVEIFKLRGKKRDDFFQSKYDYYKKFNIWAIAASCFAFLLLFTTDFSLYQYAWVSLLRRALVFVPLAVIVLVYRKTTNYKVMSALTFIMIHAMIWDNIWVNSYFSDSHVSEGFLFMGFLLLIASFCSSPRYAFIAQWGLVWDVILSNNIYHYSNYSLIITYTCQVILLLNIINVIVTKLYYDHYSSEKQLKLLSFYDPLTQMFNRNKLDEITTPDHDLSFISDDICIMIIDIDFFKKVNDTYGHDRGDFVLQFVSNIIKNSLRRQDVVIRWGGEEFVAILLDSKTDQSYLVAERMRNKIAETDNGLCEITVSIGLARYEGGDCVETIKNADEALYQAKQSGRNKVSCHASCRIAIDENAET